MKKKIKSQNEINSLLCLFLQGALLDMITPNIRAVFYEWSKECVTLYFIFDKEVSAEDREEASCVETEVSVDYMTIDEEMPFDTECVQIDYPKPIIARGVCVYQRYEENVR